MTTADELRDQRLYDEIAQMGNDYGALHRRAVRDLARCRSELEETQGTLGAVAHDLRAPLSAMLGYTEILMADEQLSSSQRDLAERLGRAGRSMATLTDELVEAVTAGSSPLRLEPVDLRVVAAHVIARHQLLHLPRRVQVRLDKLLSTTADTIIQGDEPKLERLLENLISNAVKFSPEGGEVLVAMIGDASFIEIRVSDHGPGLPPEQLDQVFNPFHRTPDAASVPGVGLGLTIVKQLTERHGGRVHVESVLGEGATFVVRLPHHLTSPLDG